MDQTILKQPCEASRTVTPNHPSIEAGVTNSIGFSRDQGVPRNTGLSALKPGRSQGYNLKDEFKGTKCVSSGQVKGSSAVCELGNCFSFRAKLNLGRVWIKGRVLCILSDGSLFLTIESCPKQTKDIRPDQK